MNNLAPHLQSKDLCDMFSTWGNILSCKVAMDSEGRSKGYGFVHFETEEGERIAIQEMRGMEVEGYTLEVERFVPRQTHDSSDSWTSVFVKYIPKSWTKEDVCRVFSAVGLVISVHIPRDHDRKYQSRGFGFVNFAQSESARAAVRELDGQEVTPDRNVREPSTEMQPHNLMCYPQDHLGPDGRPVRLAVSRAQTKRQRQPRQQVRDRDGLNPATPALAARFQSQQQMARQAGFGGSEDYMAMMQQLQQQQMRYGMNPAAMAAMQSGGQYDPRMMGMMQGGVVPAAQNGRPGAGRGGGRGGVSCPPAADPRSSRQSQISINLQSLSSMDPKEQKNFVGEQLYRLISAVEPLRAPQITGMLLEGMDMSDLINLLESPEVLRTRLGEAVHALESRHPLHSTPGGVGGGPRARVSGPHGAKREEHRGGADGEMLGGMELASLLEPPKAEWHYAPDDAACVFSVDQLRAMKADASVPPEPVSDADWGRLGMLKFAVTPALCPQLPQESSGATSHRGGDPRGGKALRRRRSRSRNSRSWAGAPPMAPMAPVPPGGGHYDPRMMGMMQGGVVPAAQNGRPGAGRGGGRGGGLGGPRPMVPRHPPHTDGPWYYW